ncbi:hypothetical protein GCM10022245_77040 [Streptomyces mayteni]
MRTTPEPVALPVEISTTLGLTAVATEETVPVEPTETADALVPELAEDDPPSVAVSSSAAVPPPAAAATMATAANNATGRRARFRCLG